MCDSAAFDGVALSSGVINRLGATGVMVKQCRWRYGDAPRTPFPPHRRLAGAFTTITGKAGSGFDGFSGWRPGDHKGCLCSLVPVFCAAPRTAALVPDVLVAAMAVEDCGEPTGLGQVNGLNILKSEQLTGGVSGDRVDLLDLADGTRVVRKTYADRNVRIKDRVTADLAEAIDAPVARILGQEGNSLIFEYVEGEHVTISSVIEAEGSRELGLLDYITGNFDRNDLNVRLKPDGSLVGIDHGMTFQDEIMNTLYGQRFPGFSKFIDRWVTPVLDGSDMVGTRHAFSTAEIDNVLKAAKQIDMPPEFLKQIEGRIALMRETG